jgi:cellulose synthase/poly-beta-1,6-N-acetylglucosamine synthase-like glycosyltransferase
MREILATVSAGVFGAVGPGLLTWVIGPLLLGRRELVPAIAGSGLLVIIPAHNEERTLAQTINSVLLAAKEAGLGVRVIVGADSCSDHTAAVAMAAGAQVEGMQNHSKWKTLSSLAQHAPGHAWVAIVDAGALWPKTLLSDIRPLLSDGRVFGVAPAYYPASASILERNLWRLEAFWKRGENRAGGPVSVHGATVLYRSRALQASLDYLQSFGRESWLNDDVAIPFAARLLYPGSSLVYWCPREVAKRVSDAGLREAVPQAGRRARMVAGNLEWAVTLFPAALLSSPGLAVVALRRLLRIFWVYWAMLAAYGFFLAIFGSNKLALLALAGGAGGLALVMFAGGKRGLLDAAVASLSAPLLIYPVIRGRKRKWA